MIENTFTNKSANPESLKKYLQHLKSSSTNRHIVSDDLLRAFYKLLCLWFYVLRDQWKNTVSQRFYKKFERLFYMKIIVTILPANLVTNSL